MVNFQKLESSVASLEKQLQEVKEQLAEVRNEYQEECHPGKTDIREYILEKATERFGEYYKKSEKDKKFFDDFYDAVKRKVKKDSIIMGLRVDYVGMVFCDNAVYVFRTYTPFQMEFMVQYDEIEDVDYEKSGNNNHITITVSETATVSKKAEKNNSSPSFFGAIVQEYLEPSEENNGSSKFSVSAWTSDGDLIGAYKFLLDILEYVSA